jgi:hypothetical protein
VNGDCVLVKLFLLIVTLLCGVTLSSCAPATIADVRTSIGDEYHVLKFPVVQHNIGSEWSKQFNATGKGMLTEDKVRVEKSLKRMDRATANQVALGIAALSPSGIGGGSGFEADLIKQVNLHDLQIVKPISLGYISFKPGVSYVTEALRIEGFAIDNDKKLKFKVNATGSATPDRASANFGVETGASSGFGGEGLVIGYVVQSVEKGSYQKQDFGPVELSLSGKKTPVGTANLSAVASYEKIVAGSGKSLPKNLLWACKRAASKKDTINAAWVVTLHVGGEEKKTLKIAFPAYPEVEDCSEFESIIASGINSVTDQIERTVAHIVIDRALLNEMIEPAEFTATVSATKESFKIVTIAPES